MRHPAPEDAFAGMTVEEMKEAERADSRYRCQEVTIETWKVSRKHGSVEIQWDHGTTTGRDLGVIKHPDVRLAVERMKPPFRARWYGGAGLGDRSHGLEVLHPEDGWIEVYYETPLEREATRAKESAEYDRRKRERYAGERTKLDARFDALPELFKMRIRERRERQPAFRVDHEGYETFCCQQAVVMAETALTLSIAGGPTKLNLPEGQPEITYHLSGPNMARTSEPIGWLRDEDGYLGGREKAEGATEWLERWSKMKHKQQQTAMPRFEGSQHSGNTYGAALRLAVLYLVKPIGVVRQAGALAAIGGSEKYGDPTNDELREAFPNGVAWAREDVTA